MKKTDDIFRADLHCHSCCSDGELTPVELVHLAHKIGLKGLSITDHDSIEAYKTAVPEAQKLQILLGTGVEFSCEYREMSIHVLGYGFRVEAENLHLFCTKHQARREERNRAMLELLAKHGMPLEKTELSRFQGTIGRPHIAQLLVEKKYVADIREAFFKYLGDGKSCFVRGRGFSIEETIAEIDAAGGKAFLAHPHLLQHSGYLKEILSFPFKGIECYYARCTPKQERRWLKVAQSRNLLISGGSDFHGKIKPNIPLGCSWIGEEAFHAIFEKNKTDR